MDTLLFALVTAGAYIHALIVIDILKGGSSIKDLVTNLGSITLAYGALLSLFPVYSPYARLVALVAWTEAALWGFLSWVSFPGPALYCWIAEKRVDTIRCNSLVRLNRWKLNYDAYLQHPSVGTSGQLLGRHSD